MIGPTELEEELRLRAALLAVGAKSALEKTGQLLPTVILFGLHPSGQALDALVIPVTMPQDLEERNKIANQIREKAREFGAVAACLIAETWVTFAPMSEVNLDPIKGPPVAVRPQNDPARMEAVCIMLQTYNGRISSTCPIIREKGKRTLDPQPFKEEDLVGCDAFFDLLPRRGEPGNEILTN
jgi:hypothetical protein